AAVAVLAAGGSALDAVEAGIKPVELNPADQSVGVGGLPNMLGQVELDASIMDGCSRAAGAVGALQGYAHPIALARKVMELLPHVFLVGDGAARFAEECGYTRQELLTLAAREAWQRRLTEAPPASEPGLQRYYAAMGTLRERVNAAVDPAVPNETVNFLALDAGGHLATGVSTSGWAWKYPGRLGDSPVIGAGNYADDRYGAAACTGRGELAIRACTAFATVMHMRAGLPPDDACAAALRDVLALDDPYAGPFNIVALDPAGHPGAASNRANSSYIAMAPGQTEPVTCSRIHVQ
ncbi:MAG TPA: N(4)-(beta-N-acetylglucosaminyl)-L-asparaginase, partial [Chloroflexota bacterium]|nr:N(4)-(beta-N-acetylglucosaminyl)-L-asparaginase [Chloroflexota bacterium]